jgi:hypothetical protein
VEITMKVLLTGMFNRQLAEVADELRAEFPEVDVEVIGNDEGKKRIVNASSGAALVVSGRFMDHKTWRAMRKRATTKIVDCGASGIAAAVRDFLRRA